MTDKIKLDLKRAAECADDLHALDERHIGNQFFNNFQ
jgi:hypothetical protein